MRADRSVGLDLVRWAGVAAAVVLVVAPLVALLPEAAGELGAAAGPLARRAGLLLRSVRFAAAVAATDTALGLAAAVWWWMRPRRAALWLPAVLLGVVVPTVTHIAVIARLAEAFPAAVLSPGVLAWLCESAVFLPVAFALAVLGLRSVEGEAVDAARVQGGDARAVAGVGVPLAAPAVLAGFGMVFAMVLGDMSVASSFGYDVYAMELYAEYSASGSVGSTFVLAVPLLLVAVTVAVLCATRVRDLVTAASDRAAFRTSGALRHAAWAAPAAFVAAGWPLAVVGATLLSTGGPGAFGASVADASKEIGVSALVGVLAGLLAAVIALALQATALPRGGSRLLWAPAVAALAVPGPLLGAGLVGLYGARWLAPVNDTVAILVLAALARWLPVAILGVAAVAARSPRRAAEAGLLAAPPGRVYRRLVAPRLVPAAAAAGLAVAALSVGEIGATVMVVPPGLGTVSVRLYNLLHYGASPEVAALSAAVALAAAAAAAGAWALSVRVRRAVS